MKEEYPYQFNGLSGAYIPVREEVSDNFGCWDIHTHRRVADWQHAILNCQPDSLEELYGEPLYLSVGIHPWYLTEDNILLLWENLLEAVRDKRVVAIGEAGLDKKTNVSFDLQCVVFHRVIALADELNLPLLIHNVKASNEIIRMKKELQPCNPWIVHGFRGRKELAQAYLRQGIYLSYGEKYQEEALRVTPLDSLFIETDESETGVCELYGKAAKVLEIPERKLREKIEQNVNKLFFR